ncbi:MFS transporter [Catellatospora citrea]|uniref:MFS transporter n=1 Tax=Catellatospora citrea TaxID=53366 RepID=A0A8J3K2M3_9ACTN|nr:MFS transporter [Catellatospora citrea]RKE07381.1 MFS transporter [Catellatospora citrea]GIF95537.1 MFS transporter [Catellatospora citrea]
MAGWFPPRGELRSAAYATFANTVGGGLWSAGGALYLTRVADLPATVVGAGLSAAALVGLAASVPAGRLADRRDPRSLRAALQVVQAGAALAFLLVDSTASFLAVAVVDALLVTGNLTVRAALVGALGRTAGRVHVFATLRTAANAGTGIGAGLAALALAVDSPAAYRMLVVADAATYLISAALLLRLPRYPAADPEERARTWEVWRDGRFLAVTATTSAMYVRRVVLTLVLPLWIATRADVPAVVVSALLVTYTVLTVVLSTRLGRRAEEPEPAARMVRRGSLVLAVAMLGFAAATTLSTAATVTLLLASTVVYSVGELWHVNGATGLSYALAPEHAIGQYQGVTVLLNGLALAAGPVLLTVVIVDSGSPAGWLAPVALLTVCGLAVPPLARWARAAPARPAPAVAEPAAG